MEATAHAVVDVGDAGAEHIERAGSAGVGHRGAAAPVEDAVDGQVAIGADGCAIEVRCAAQHGAVGKGLRAAVESDVAAGEVEHAGVVALGLDQHRAGARIDGATIEVVEACLAGESAVAGACGLGERAGVVEVAAVARIFGHHVVAGEVEATGVVEHRTVVDQQFAAVAGGDVVIDGAGVVDGDRAQRVEATAHAVVDVGDAAGTKVECARTGDARSRIPVQRAIDVDGMAGCDVQRTRAVVQRSFDFEVAVECVVARREGDRAAEHRVADAGMAAAGLAECGRHEQVAGTAEGSAGLREAGGVQGCIRDQRAAATQHQITCERGIEPGQREGAAIDGEVVSGACGQG